MKKRFSNFKFTTRTVIALLAAVLILLFMITNREKVKIDLLIAELSLPLWSLVLITTGLGILIGFALNGKSKKIKI
jgi:uncharacterized integral membrane protein